MTTFDQIGIRSISVATNSNEPKRFLPPAKFWLALGLYLLAITLVGLMVPAAVGVDI